MFELTIHLGNAVMDSPGDVARVLRKVAQDLDFWDSSDSREVPEAGDSIFDENGNRVGAWKYAG